MLSSAGRFPDVKTATGTRFRVWVAGTNAFHSLVVRLPSFMLFPWTWSGLAECERGPQNPKWVAH